MSRGGTFASIDIGTTKVCTVVGEMTSDEDMRILGVGVATHIGTGVDSAIQNLTKCVENVGVQVDGLILEPLASAEAVLDEEEKQQGVVLADIGGGTTDVALYIEGSVYHTAVLPVGGNHVTRDVVVGLRAPYQAAEDAKRKWGHAIPSMVDAS